MRQVTSRGIKHFLLIVVMSFESRYISTKKSLADEVAMSYR